MLLFSNNNNLIILLLFQWCTALITGNQFTSYRRHVKRESGFADYEKQLWESALRTINKRKTTDHGFLQPQGVTATGFQDCGANVLFVVDSTGSVRDFFDEHRQYLLRVINHLEVIGNQGTCIGLIVYSSELRKKILTSFENCKNRDDLTKIVEGLPFFSGITATGSALKLSYTAVGTRHNITPTNVVVITDGFSYDDVGGPAEILQQMPNVRTFAVTVSNKWRQAELETIAGDPKRVFQGLDSADKLAMTLSACKRTMIKEEPKAYDAFVNSAESKTSIITPLPTFRTTTPAYVPEHFFFNQKGEPCSCYPTCSQRTLDLLRKGELKYPPGMSTPSYYTQTYFTTAISTTIRPPTTTYTTTSAISTSGVAYVPDEDDYKIDTSITAFKQRVQGCVLDLLVVLDASGSIRQRFQRQLDLIVELIDRLQIGPDETRVALIKYAGPQKARLVFDFDRYTTKEELKNAFKRVRFIGGITYTNEALLKAEQVLRQLNGIHSYATSAVVVLTDGFSHEDPGSGAALIRERGVPVYAVAINHVFPVNNEELLTIAGDRSRVYLDSERNAFENEIEQLSLNCRRK